MCSPVCVVVLIFPVTSNFSLGFATPTPTIPNDPVDVAEPLIVALAVGNSTFPDPSNLRRSTPAVLNNIPFEGEPLT